MAHARSNMDTAIGIILVVLGGLSLLRWIDLGWIVTVAAVVAIVVGILILVKQLKGSVTMGVILLVLGLLLLAPLGRGLDSFLATAVAVALLVLGILKLMGKW